MSEEGRTIGRVVADLVVDEFAGLTSKDGSPGVRLIGFAQEARYIVERLLERNLRLPGHTELVKIVVGSREPQDGIPREILLASDWTMTRHRNENYDGLIIIELDRQSDETGIRAMHTISDADLLDQPNQSLVRRRLRHITAIDWGLADPKNALDPPEVLLDTLEEVFHHLLRVRRPALRTWVTYTAIVNRRLVGLHHAVTGPEIRGIASEELSSLNLFTDPDLFSETTRIQVGRRLERNAHVADLDTPQGRSLRDDELGTLIDNVELRDTAGDSLSTEVNVQLRQRMREILTSGGPDAGHSIELRIWEQLFEKRRTIAGLGDRIYSFLEGSHPHRLEEFEDLAVREGLNAGEDHAALGFLESLPAAEELPLADTVPVTLRKKVERIAFQGERIESDVLIAILYGLNALDFNDASDTPQTVTLEWEQATQSATRSGRLFAFLYRGTLDDVAATCDGSTGTRFEVDDSIRDIPSIAGLFVDELAREDDVDERFQTEWAPLRFKLIVTGTSTPLIRFRWDPRQVPGLAAFAGLISIGGANQCMPITDLEEWCEGWLEPFDSSPEAPPASSDDLIRTWSALNEVHFRKWSFEGLDVGSLDEYLDDWIPILSAAREQFVPAGGGLKSLDEFLSRDTARTDAGRLIMLASHPMRLRWYRHHMWNLYGFICRSLFGELRLNSENDSLFFNWIERASPHLQPPVMSGGAHVLARAVRELQLHEEYATVRSGDNTQPAWLSALDDASIDELVTVSRTFLAAFPQKVGGLSVLLMATADADKIAQRYVTRLRSREYSSVDLELHVVTAASEHDAVAVALSDLDSDDGRGRSLLPRFRLVLHDWDGPIPNAFGDLEGRIDVALAPNLFGLHCTALEETRRSEAGVGGHFDPWLDPTTHIRPAAEGTINVSEVLLPEVPDPPLEDWSTLAVRRTRQAPVAPDDPSGIDFVTLQVAFDKNELLFKRLHDLAHWVVTLDPFVGRDQIDALDNAPDIIVVRSDVGKQENYTLVVSSAVGRPWVTQRLTSRLEDDFSVEPEHARAVAERLYEIGRHAVPSLMLRAVGLGRTTEEILGLILARYAVERFASDEIPFVGVEYWLSLDEHMDWFGGANRVRPDLLRVRIHAGESTRLELLVLESKFRQAFAIGTADDQVVRGMALFDGALGVGDGEPSDARFWRRELATAVMELSHRSALAADLPAVRIIGEDTNESSLLEDLRTGNYDYGGAEGVVCATAWADGTDSAEFDDLTPGGHRLVRLGRERILELLADIERKLPPAGSKTIAGKHLVTPGAEVLPAIPIEPIASELAVAEQDEREMTSPSKEVEVAPDSVAAYGRRGMTVEELESRYARILTRLDQLGVAIDRPEGQPFKEGPGFFRFRVVPRAGVSTDRVTGKTEDIKLALALPAELNIRSYVDKGAVVFEVPKEDEDRYYVSAQTLWNRTQNQVNALIVPIGENIDGDTVYLDFSSSDTPHLLIAGQTGSGKTIALETILAGLCHFKEPNQLRLHLVDPKSTELIEFADDPHVDGSIGWDADDATRMLAVAVEEMGRRYELFRGQKVRSLPEYNAVVASEEFMPWWLMVLDEYADLTADPDDRKAIESDLKRIAQKGRAAGIHLIVATQKPSAEVISTVIRSNLPAALALRVKSAIDSRIILGEAGAESLAGKGDAFLRTTRGLQRVQCAMVVRN
jgi:hypothetical protein